MDADGFYLGTHETGWLRRNDVGVPLFVSRRRLARLKCLEAGRPLTRNGQPVYGAVTRFAVDSGGFSEIAEHGRWTLTPQAYADELRRIREGVGPFDWAAPQDWMCEPVMLGKTRMTVHEHQARTLVSVLELRRLLHGEGLHIVPVLQGWNLDDYLRHVDQYRTAGIDLATEPLVGLGSVCRRQALGEATAIVQGVAALGIRLHGFGMKGEGLALYGAHLTTADSMAWSYAGRRRPHDDCPNPNASSCSNCLHYALAWRAQALATVQPSSGAQVGLALRWRAVPRPFARTR